MQWLVRIPLRDRTRLSATLYRPRNQRAASPALLTLTPYVAQISHDAGVYFASNGYPFLTIDVRGRGNSEGEFNANGNEARDAHDVVEWVAGQPWCNGNVAMWGGSYSGYVQWGAASEFSPRLATIVPVASPYRGVDSPAHANIFAPYRVRWLNLLAGRTSQERIFADQSFWNRQFRYWFESGTPFRNIDSLLGNASPIFQEWLSHPARDDYWDSFNPTAEQYSRMSLPVLTITGIYDTNQIGALKHYREHLRNASAEACARHYLVIGPWDHGGTRTPKTKFGGIEIGPAGLLDLGELHLQWYAWTMQGGPRPRFLQKRVAYYVMGAEKWRYVDSLEQATARHEPLYLSAHDGDADAPGSGALVAASGRGGPDQYIYDPADVSLAELESSVDPHSLTDQRMILAASGRQLIYHSALFTEDTDVTGFFRLCAWISIDQPDTDFRASLFEVCADGSAIRLTMDCLRARYREGLREPRLIATTAPLRYDFELFTFVSRRLSKGARLRLVIGPVNSIFHEKNYNSGGTVADESIKDARRVTVRIYHDELHPSVLYMPVGQPDDSPQRY